MGDNSTIYCHAMRRILAAGAALLLCTSVRAQQGNSWLYWKDFLLGPARDLLMESCATGRQANANGISIFSPRLRKKTVQSHIKGGRSLIEAEAMVAGEAAAMGRVCPNVW